MINQWVIGGFPTGAIGLCKDRFDRIEAAARWLRLSREAFSAPVLPVVKERFALNNMGAIERAQRAYRLASGGRHE